MEALKEKIKKLVRHPVSVTVAALILFERIMVLIWQGSATFQWTHYILGTFLSGLFWVFLYLACTLISTHATLLATIFAGIAALLTMMSLGAFTYLNDGISSYMVYFALLDPHYVWTFVRSYLNIVILSSFLATFTAFFILWRNYLKVSQPTPSRWFKLSATLLTLIVILVSLNQMRAFIRNSQLPIDAALLLAFKNVHHMPIQNKQLQPHQAPIIRKQEASVDAPNILVIIHESWGKERLSFYRDTNTDAHTRMPYLKQWLADERSRRVIFKNAYASSSTTSVSMPSLLTGIAPYENRNLLHRAPLLWEWVSGFGYQTIFVTAQRFHFANFDRFFFSPGPDAFLSADMMDDPLVNDEGVDDIVATQYFLSLIKKTRRPGKPFLAVFNSSALHTPGLAHSEHVTGIPPVKSRYDRALYIIDHSTRLIFETLADDLNNTIVILTSDHGDSDDRFHRMPRIDSFYDEVMNIPFIIRVPEEWKKKNQIAWKTMSENKNAITGNLDVVPTVVSLLDFTSNKSWQPLHKALSGESLFSILPNDRHLIALNITETRPWPNRGIGIYWQDWRFVFSDKEGPRLYQASDIKQTTNLWPSRPDLVIKIEQVIKRTPTLPEIYHP